ncbi:putative O-methyltransferase domain, S-adenosyl-L-methionine-dependent methyltransferase [Helianthus anomalus]
MNGIGRLLLVKLVKFEMRLRKAWTMVHKAVVDSSTEPFVKENGGETAYDMYGRKLEMNEMMQKAMSGISVPFMKAILEGYDGFKGVERLVDVGGDAGDCLRIVSYVTCHVIFIQAMKDKKATSSKWCHVRQITNQVIADLTEW